VIHGEIPFYFVHHKETYSIIFYEKRSPQNVSLLPDDRTGPLCVDINDSGKFY
jgi:hypothetical protein